MRRALTQAMTPRSRWVHAAFGVILPVAFLVLDPAVFRVNDDLAFGLAYLGAYRAFGYVATLVAAAVAARALFGRSLGPFAAGMLYGAAAVALLLGVAILPLSLLGLVVFGIGVLGLSPFVAAWVYLRQGARRHHEASGRLASARAAIGALVFLALPVAAQLLTNRGVGWGVAHVDSAAGARLVSALRVVYDANELIARHEQASPEEQRRLGRAFQLMTGDPIEERMANLVD